MDYQIYGRTGLKVSNIALGTWQLGGAWGSFDRGRAIAAIRHARDEGINLFDTAQAYGFGASEEILGEALREDLARRRDEVVIATKGGLRPTSDGVARDSSRHWLHQGVEQSLRRLGVETIDVYQVHWPDNNVPFEDSAKALAEMMDEGKIAHVGVSNFDVGQMRDFSKTYPIESLQSPYHMFRREIETDILSHTDREDIGMMAYGPLAHGLLTGMLRPTTKFADDDWRGKHSIFQGETYQKNLEVVDQLAEVASDLGCTLSQLAIAWVLSNPAVDVTIVGSRSSDHISEAAAASNIHLPQDVVARIDDILAGASQIGGPSPEGN